MVISDCIRLGIFVPEYELVNSPTPAIPIVPLNGLLQTGIGQSAPGHAIQRHLISWYLRSVSRMQHVAQTAAIREEMHHGWT
jgi:hypothetical protein